LSPAKEVDGPWALVVRLALSYYVKEDQSYLGLGKLDLGHILLDHCSQDHTCFAVPVRSQDLVRGLGVVLDILVEGEDLLWAYFWELRLKDVHNFQALGLVSGFPSKDVHNHLW
jgi:hypothetical protein